MQEIMQNMRSYTDNHVPNINLVRALVLLFLFTFCIIFTATETNETRKNYTQRICLDFVTIACLPKWIFLIFLQVHSQILLFKKIKANYCTKI